MEDRGADWELLIKNAKFKLDGRDTLKRLTMSSVMTIFTRCILEVLREGSKAERTGFAIVSFA